MTLLPPPPPPGQPPHTPPYPSYPGQPFSPPPPPKKSASKALIGVGACTALFVIVVIAAAVSPKSTKTASRSAVPATSLSTTTIAPSATTTLPPTTRTTKAPTTTTTSKDQAMSEWATIALPKVEAVQEHMEEMSGYTEIDDISKMGRSCRLWQSDLSALRAVLPSPDADVTAAMTSGLDDYDMAAELCITGTSEFDATAMRQAASYITQGTAHFNEATAALD